MKKRILMAWALVLLLTAVSFPLTQNARHRGLTDPDRYYHLALAKIFKEQGVPKALPQVADLSWSKKFLDKEYGFHLLTGWVYRLGGETAVNALPFVFLILLFALLFQAAARFGNLKAACFIVPTAVLFTPTFLHRFSMVRPHLLATVATLGVVFSILGAKPFWAFALGAICALSYHAFYVPVVICLVAFYCFRGEDVRSRLAPLFALGGIVAGLMIHPGFPENLQATWLHSSIALDSSGIYGVRLGQELIPGPSNSFVTFFGLFLLILGLGWFYLRTVPAVHGQKARLQYLLILATLFWWLTALSPRAVEYAVPLTAMFFIVLNVLPVQRLALVAIVFIAVAFHIPEAWKYLSINSAESLDPHHISEALTEIPSAASGKKILNCEWDTSPLIFYYRPDLKFVDIMDPNFLRIDKPDLYETRLQLCSGLTSDPWITARRMKSQYVLVREPGTVNQFERDPRVRRLYPRKTVDLSKYSGVLLYELTDSLSPRWVNRYKTRQEAGCEVAEMAPVESQEHAGAQYLGVHLPTGARVLRNGKPLYAANLKIYDRVAVQKLVPLQPVLQARDKLEVELCRPVQSGEGFSLSFWNNRQIAEVCGAPEPENLAQWTGAPQRTCFAPFAIEKVSMRKP